MIIYGYGTKEIPVESLGQAVCASCGKSGLNKYVSHSYAHIYWLPIVSMSRHVSTECTSCGEVLEGKNVPEEIRKSISRIERKKRPPRIRTAAAAVILIFVALFGLDRYDKYAAQEEAAGNEVASVSVL